MKKKKRETTNKLTKTNAYDIRCDDDDDDVNDNSENKLNKFRKQIRCFNIYC